MQTPEPDSREKIIKAAIAVFAEKGKYGARMEAIAAKAEVNKAMVYYYYSTKENLYHEALRSVISTNIARTFGLVAEMMDTTADSIEMLKKFIAVYFDVFSAEKTYTKLMLDAVASEPHEIEQIVSDTKLQLQLNMPLKFLSFLEDGMAKGVFRRVDPKQLLINMISMTMFYFFGKPAIKAMLDLPVEDEQQFLQARQAAIIDLLLFGIVENRSRTS